MTPEQDLRLPGPRRRQAHPDRWVIRRARDGGNTPLPHRQPFIVTKFDQQRRIALRHHDYARTVLYHLGDYRQAPDIEATWFIDPPYQASPTATATGPRRSTTRSWPSGA